MGDVVKSTRDVVKSMRDVPPLSYIMNIEPFSLLSELLELSGKEKYESNEFEAGGHKWKMILFPTKGNKKSNVDGYISLYLKMTDASPSSDVNVMLNFFVLDQIRNKYITFEDKRLRTFNAMINVRGISRMLSLGAFQDPSNGYICDDCCIFGTEIVVVEPDRKGEKLTIIQYPDNATFSWKLAKFSTLKDELHLSDQFAVGGLKWKLQLYPKGVGEGEGKGKWVSIYLAIQDCSELRPGWKVYASYKLVMKDQLHDNHEEVYDKDWFCASSLGWGFSRFISQADMEDEKRGFIVNDNVILEVKITFMSMLNPVA